MKCTVKLNARQKRLQIFNYRLGKTRTLLSHFPSSEKQILSLRIHAIVNLTFPNTQIVNDIPASRHVDEKKFVGFGSEGASVMTSKNNGVATRLKRVQ